jgi:hypothetical protein
MRPAPVPGYDYDHIPSFTGGGSDSGFAGSPRAGVTTQDLISEFAASWSSKTFACLRSGRSRPSRNEP